MYDAPNPASPPDEKSGEHAVHPEPAPNALVGGEREVAVPSAQSDAAIDASSDASSATDASEITTDQIKLALRRVKDPELNLNILDLGLVYDMAVEGSAVKIDMSLTSPGCPSGPEIMGDAERQLRSIPGVGDVAVNLVWSPPWTPDRIEPRVRAYLGF